MDRQEGAGLKDDWRFFGPYLAERQWGTIREDYSADGACWDYFPHDHARSRAYRWGEDGLLGFCDRQGRLCFGLALWNGRDPILKERLFGLAAPEGNHGEDGKELYYYLDSTPNHSYFKALYKYPLWAYPYEWLVRESRRRHILDPEFEIEDTGVFDRNRYVDVTAEYAKTSPTDIAIRLTLANRSGDDALLHVIPQLWFRNTWSWGRVGEKGYAGKPHLRLGARRCIALEHEELGRYLLEAGVASSGVEPQLIFTENETNMERLFGTASASPYVKDAFHESVVNGRTDRVNPENEGTKAGAHYRLAIPARESVVLQLRLASEADVQARLGLRHVEDTFKARLSEADRFYETNFPESLTDDEKNVLRQGYASLLWSKQFYNFDVSAWIKGDPGQPSPPEKRLTGRNWDWGHLVNHDLISVPDKWEYPWYAAWDLAFHMIPFARIDPEFARSQLALFLSERYLHPKGQLPAYEFAFSHVNPPVHAWACLRVADLQGRGGREDFEFLASTFPPLVKNFRWWKSLGDSRGSGFFNGGFLGLDNIGAFDRGVPPPQGGWLEQADGTGWMAFFSLNLLQMAVALSADDPSAHEDLAIEFFDQFAAIERAINRPNGEGLWDDAQGFYFDHVNVEGVRLPVKVRSMVGLIPFFSVLVLDRGAIDRLPRLARRIDEFVGQRGEKAKSGREILALATRDQLTRVLRYVLDETSLLAPTGVRSLSKHHKTEPFILHAKGGEYRVEYAPDDSRTQAFGINSNWRGPVWFPLNYLLVDALRQYHAFYGDSLTVECPTGSGVSVNLKEVAVEVERRLASTFLVDGNGRRPCHGANMTYRNDPHFKNLVLFHEYFSGDTGRGFGASHQTGWTSLVLPCIEAMAARRGGSRP